ncbi:MAG: hypothetical protein OXC05_01065 [Halieaceae bacterium]|nr:hypothetical protein [Halieaceae bacterium]
MSSYAIPLIDALTILLVFQLVAACSGLAMANSTIVTALMLPRLVKQLI